MSHAADVISKTDQAASPGKPRKRNRIPFCHRRKKLRKRREPRRSTFYGRGGLLHQVARTLTVAHESKIEASLFWANTLPANTAPEILAHKVSCTEETRDSGYECGRERVLGVCWQISEILESQFGTV